MKIEFHSRPPSQETISGKQVQWATVDEQGRLIIPQALAAKWGLTPGAEVRLDEDGNSIRLHRPPTHLAKVFIEPTDGCNLDCITCFRNAWDEPVGRMKEETFAAIYEGLKQLDPMPTVYFGGIGEPLFHARTIDWIRQVKELGARVELISNGTTLTERNSRRLIDAGLDLLWVSLDGATPEAYGDVRLGAELPRVLENLERFRKMRKGGHFPRPEMGIAFVAMKRNINELPALLKLGLRMGIKYVSVSNVQPVDDDMQDERLYVDTMRSLTYLTNSSAPKLILPKMDFNETTRSALFQAFDSGYSVSYAGASWGGSNDVCGFVEDGSMSIAWNGEVSPCWPLMHTHYSYLHGKKRLSVRHVVGNVHDASLQDIWLNPEYVAYRKRVQSFAFPPCTFCGGCDVSVSNQEDCFNNEAPVCGGCLWAQGLVRCP